MMTGGFTGAIVFSAIIGLAIGAALGGLVLWMVGLASVGILILIYKIKFSYGKSSLLSHMFALLGAMVFTIHTLVLDAVIWPFFYF